MGAGRKMSKRRTEETIHVATVVRTRSCSPALVVLEAARLPYLAGSCPLHWTAHPSPPSDATRSHLPLSGGGHGPHPPSCSHAPPPCSYLDSGEPTRYLSSQGNDRPRASTTTPSSNDSSHSGGGRETPRSCSSFPSCSALSYPTATSCPLGARSFSPPGTAPYLPTWAYTRDRPERSTV